MGLTAEEGKARRLAGMKRANLEMSTVERIYRALVNGRPPASEFKTPLAALTAARVLYRDLEARMTAEGLSPKSGDWSVIIGYVSADLSFVGFTPPVIPGEDAQLMPMLNGHIMLGLIFGMKEPGGKFIVGTRPFLTMKQADAWLEELLPIVRSEMEV
jgi:hypothetical protein